VEKQFWLDRWEERQIGFHLPQVNAHLRKHWSALQLNAGDRVLVPLCGKSLDMLWLHEIGHGVLGVELSHIAVQEFFEENALDMKIHAQDVFSAIQTPAIQLRQGDFFDLNSADVAGIKGVYDRAALVALPEDMRRKYVRHLAAILHPGAVVLLVSMDYPQQEMDGPPFSVSEDEVRRLYAGNFEVQLMDTVDVLAGNERLAQRGLTRMLEQIWKLVRL
jgi:thiopurine S-methyltransferase